MVKHSEKPERLNRNAAQRQSRDKGHGGATTPPTPAPTPAHDPAAGAGGFTLLELMVVIFVMGIITAWIVVSWSSFMRAQELRGDAINLHKEILALRARAMENDDEAAIEMGVGATTNNCVVTWNVCNEADAGDENQCKSGELVTRTKTVPLNQHVIIDTDDAGIGATSGELVMLAANKWKVSATEAKIKIDPVVLRNDPFNVFEEGRIVLKSSLTNKVKAQYCIQKDNTCMKPEIYHRTKAGGAWKRL